MLIFALQRSYKESAMRVERERLHLPREVWKASPEGLAFELGSYKGLALFEQRNTRKVSTRAEELAKMLVLIQRLTLSR